jgi:hypothetical protein
MYDSMGKVGILSAVAGPNANVDIDVVHDVPSECPSKFVLSVTNTNRLDLRHSQAAYGVVGIDLGAPGTSIYSTKPSNTYGVLNRNIYGYTACMWCYWRIVHGCL